MSVTNPALKFLSPHLMASLGGAVAMSVGAVETTGDYVDDDLVDGDPMNPVLTTNGTATFAVTGTSTAGVNGAAIVNHSLDEDTNAVISGDASGTIIAPAVPPGGVRRNAYVTFPPATVANLNLAITGHSGGAFYIGNFFYGKFQEMLAMQPDATHDAKLYEILTGGEYGGLSQSLGARGRVYGGQIIVDDATAAMVDDWFEACDNNAYPSIIIPFPNRDPWCVKWTQYKPHPVSVDTDEPGAWILTLEWEELPRVRWP